VYAPSVTRAPNAPSGSTTDSPGDSPGDPRTTRLEEIARVYDATKDFDGILTRYAWELLAPRIPRDGRVLEMGCSSGVMTQHLAAHAQSLWVLDGSRKYLDDVAAKIPRHDVRYELGLFEEWSPPEHVAFDAIVMARALEHLADPRPTLERVARWLTVRGEVHVMVPNALSFHRLVGVAMGMIPEPHALNDRDRAYGHHRVYDPATLRAELEGAGFEVLEEGGSCLKFLSNAQMQALDPKLWDAFYEVGKQFPAHRAEIYARCRPRR
jgi:2-polyprenyl-3-methyl-5-hydroxy-6-metoxy-1,4-benzoquinol methylase